MAFDALDKNFLLAAAATLTSWLAIATLYWVLRRWRRTSERTSKQAEKAAECAKVWGIVMAVALVVVAVVISVLLVFNNAALLGLCFGCTS